MAFNSIPTSLAEMRKVAGSSIDKKYVRGIISFYRKVSETHGVNNPLAFNPTTTSGKSAKLMRALNGDVDIAKLKRECKLDSNFKLPGVMVVEVIVVQVTLVICLKHN